MHTVNFRLVQGLVDLVRIVQNSNYDKFRYN